MPSEKTLELARQSSEKTLELARKPKVDLEEKGEHVDPNTSNKRSYFGILEVRPEVEVVIVHQPGVTIKDKFANWVQCSQNPNKIAKSRHHLQWSMAQDRARNGRYSEERQTGYEEDEDDIMDVDQALLLVPMEKVDVVDLIEQKAEYEEDEDDIMDADQALPLVPMEKVDVVEVHADLIEQQRRDSETDALNKWLNSVVNVRVGLMQLQEFVGMPRFELTPRHNWQGPSMDLLEQISKTNSDDLNLIDTSLAILLFATAQANRAEDDQAAAPSDMWTKYARRLAGIGYIRSAFVITMSRIEAPLRVTKSMADIASLLYNSPPPIQYPSNVLEFYYPDLPGATFETFSEWYHNPQALFNTYAHKYDTIMALHNAQDVQLMELLGKANSVQAVCSVLRELSPVSEDALRQAVDKVYDALRKSDLIYAPDLVTWMETLLQFDTNHTMAHFSLSNLRVNNLVSVRDNVLRSVLTLSALSSCDKDLLEACVRGGCFTDRISLCPEVCSAVSNNRMNLAALHVPLCTREEDEEEEKEDYKREEWTTPSHIVVSMLAVGAIDAPTAIALLTVLTETGRDVSDARDYVGRSPAECVLHACRIESATKASRRPRVRFTAVTGALCVAFGWLVNFDKDLWGVQYMYTAAPGVFIACRDTAAVLRDVETNANETRQWVISSVATMAMAADVRSVSLPLPLGPETQYIPPIVHDHNTLRSLVLECRTLHIRSKCSQYDASVSVYDLITRHIVKIGQLSHQSGFNSQVVQLWLDNLSWDAIMSVIRVLGEPRGPNIVNNFNECVSAVAAYCALHLDCCCRMVANEGDAVACIRADKYSMGQSRSMEQFTNSHVDSLPRYMGKWRCLPSPVQWAVSHWWLQAIRRASKEEIQYGVEHSAPLYLKKADAGRDDDYVTMTTSLPAVSALSLFARTLTKWTPNERACAALLMDRGEDEDLLAFLQTEVLDWLPDLIGRRSHSFARVLGNLMAEMSHFGVVSTTKAWIDIMYTIVAQMCSDDAMDSMAQTLRVAADTFDECTKGQTELGRLFVAVMAKAQISDLPALVTFAVSQPDPIIVRQESVASSVLRRDAPSLKQSRSSKSYDRMQEGY
jgi:hypothetical protein